MKKYLLLTGVLLVLAAVLVACGGQSTDATTAAPVVTTAPTDTVAVTDAPALPELFGDALRGGRMWDKWWVVAAVDVPEGDMPLWATQSSNTRSGIDTWRCKECHGWDYKGVDGAYGGGSHTTGFFGVLQLAGTDANAILASLQGETNADHDFSVYMTEQDLTDIALFISEQVVDDVDVVGVDKMSVGDAVAGETVFSDNCVECHGPEGLAINFGDDSDPEYIGNLSAGNPWEFLNKVRFGQPGVPDMPSLIDSGYETADLADLLAYVQAFPATSLAVEGGRMYDKWFAALGMDAPEGDMPLWATQSTNTRTGNDTWRCKECHGWDYKGVDGVYATGSHATGFVGVINAPTMSTEDLTAWLDGSKNADHNFSTFMDADAVARLVAFIQTDVFDKSTFINADKTVVGGDAFHGKQLFDGVCKSCHGEDGKALNFGDDSEPEYYGTIAVDNPWEFFNKATVGQPGEHMPAGWNLGWTLQDIIDLLTYSQTLPIK